MAQRDLALHVGMKLSGEWSTIPGMLSEEVIDYLIAKWDSLEPLVRTRLLLSPLLLKKRELADLQPALARLAEAGRADKDEWVRVTAKSVGSYEGWLHTNELAHESKLVAATMGDLGRLLAAADPVLFRPREEVYLNPEVLARLRGAAPAVGPHEHFKPRAAAEAPSQRTSAGAPASNSAAARAHSALPTPAMGGGAGGLVGRPAGRPAPGGGLFLETKHSAGPRALGGQGAGASALDKRASTKVKRTATIDIDTVQQLTKQQQEAQKRQALEQQEARDADMRARAEARAAERAAKEAAKEAEVRARMEAKLAQRAQREAERVAERAQREAERETQRAERATQDATQRAQAAAERDAVMAARAEAKLAEKAARAAEREAQRAENLKRKRSVGSEGGQPVAKTPRAGDDGGAAATLDAQLAPAVVYSAEAAAAALGDAALHAAAAGAGIHLGTGGMQDLEGMQAYLEAAYGQGGAGGGSSEGGSDEDA